MYKVLVFDNFCANKTAFQIAVDNTCGLRCCHAVRNGPCSVFFSSHGKEGNKIERFIGGAQQFVDTGLG